ncbi:hypothetical protein Tco_0994240 [Tanacetum coccineum]
MDEMYRVTTSFLQGEVAAFSHGRKKAPMPWKQPEEEETTRLQKGFQNTKKQVGTKSPGSSAVCRAFPRNHAEHRLNIREGCPPVRQKKRGQAPERNKAIQEEVEKLVDAGIMKEVHYHSWLSNPVMVKKHDGTWRMCVDFKDLNNACPKDCYPLLEIDWKIESSFHRGDYTFKCFMDAFINKGIHN